MQKASKILFLVLAVIMTAALFAFGAFAAEKNIALNKPYTVKGTNAAAGWTPPEGSKPLTDGKRAVDGGGTDDLWTGFHKDSPDHGTNAGDIEKLKAEITVDLQADYEICKAVLQYRDQEDWGITPPAEIEVFIDGKSVGKMNIGTSKNNIGDAVLNLDTPVKGRKITFTAKQSGGWFFVSEVEAYAEVAEPDTEVPDTPSTGDGGAAGLSAAVILSGIGTAALIKKRG